MDDAIALVLVDPDVKLAHPVMRALEEEGLHTRKKVLALNPFDPNKVQYREPETLVCGLPLEKARQMRLLAQLLGATDFEWDLEHRTAKSSAWKAGVDVAAVKGGGGGMIHRTMSDLLQEKAKIAGKYTGGKPDIAKAESLMKGAGLSGDSELQALLYAARHDDNPPLEHVCRVEVGSEAASKFELTARAKVPGVLECKGEFKLERWERTDYRMNMTVRWDRKKIGLPLIG